MTLHSRVAATARTLALVVLARSVLSGAALGFATAALLWLFLGRVAAVTIGGIAALVLATALYRRLRGPGFSIPAVSLWIEEHVPELGYGLVTAVEGSAPSESVRKRRGCEGSV